MTDIDKKRTDANGYKRTRKDRLETDREREGRENTARSGGRRRIQVVDWQPDEGTTGYSHGGSRREETNHYLVTGATTTELAEGGLEGRGASGRTDGAEEGALVIEVDVDGAGEEEDDEGPGQRGCCCRCCCCCCCCWDAWCLLNWFASHSCKTAGLAEEEKKMQQSVPRTKQKKKVAKTRLGRYQGWLKKKNERKNKSEESRNKERKQTERTSNQHSRKIINH
jgi:hypothetical protein